MSKAKGVAIGAAVLGSLFLLVKLLEHHLKKNRIAEEARNNEIKIQAALNLAKKIAEHQAETRGQIRDVSHLIEVGAPPAATPGRPSPPARSDEIREIFPFPLPPRERLDEAICRLRDFQRGGHTRPQARAKLLAVVGGIPPSRKISGRWAHALELQRGIRKGRW